VTDPERLRQIERLERQIARVPNIKTVVGPAAVGEQTRDLREADEGIRRGKRNLRRGERDLARLESGLEDATAGVSQLRDGLIAGANAASQLASGSNEAAAGADELAGGAERADNGAEQVAAGSRRASQGSDSLLAGLDEAYTGAGQLSDGATEARQGSEQLAGGSATLRDRLRQGQVGLNALRVPAQATEDQLRRARETLSQMTVGRTDPLYAQALQQVDTALASATGSAPTGGGPVTPYPGLSASLERAAADAGTAADGADQLNDGANDLTAGLRRLENGAGELQTGLGRMRNEVQRSSSGFDRLASGASALARGVDRLSDGANELEGGLDQIASGNEQLAAELQAGFGRSGELESGLADASGEVGGTRRQLVHRRGPFKPLRDLQRFERESPRFFDSGYVVVAALDGARAIARESSLFLVDVEHGGSVGRIQALPSVPPNDPRTEKVVDDVRAVTDDFQDRTGVTAATGGSAGQLVDYDRVTAGRIPWLILCISLVTYLLLVPILRSLVLPAVAVLLNLVTVAVGFGVLTMLFVGDDPPLGGAGALDVISVAGIFSITFALSIDYQVFLLTRMREEFVRTQSGDAAIDFGIAKTARVVTGAAAIMVAVFLAFALADFTIIKQFGIGLATAVLIDATIVRLVLLPAIMRVLGERAWWMPRWLDDWLPVLDVEGSEFEHELSGMARA
jgi:putative drug exporter of the RND superfamily